MTGSCIPLTTHMSHTPGDENTSNESHTTTKRGPTHKHGILKTYEMDRFGCEKMRDNQQHHLKKGNNLERPIWLYATQSYF